MQLIEKEGMTLMRRQDGYVNATALCKSAGKLWGSYFRNEATQSFLEELESVMQIRIAELVQVKMGGIPSEQGTYVHPLVAVNLGQWLSPKFAVFVSMVIEGKFLKPLSQEAAGLVSAKRYSWSPYPKSLKGRIKGLYGGGAPFIYGRILEKAVGEEAAEHLRHTAGKGARWMWLSPAGLYQLEAYASWLDMHTAPTQTRTDFESVLFGKESNYLPFERVPAKVGK